MINYLGDDALEWLETRNYFSMEPKIFAKKYLNVAAVKRPASSALGTVDDSQKKPKILTPEKPKSLPNSSPLNPDMIKKAAEKAKVSTDKPINKVEKQEEVEKRKFKWNPNAVRASPPNAGNKDLPNGVDGCLNGLTFVITGVLDSLEREQAEDLIKRYGGYDLN